MAQNQKKQNFLQGAALLALAVVIVKIIGAVYKIPLKAIIGDVGFSYFNTAYEIYTLLLTISTAGLPVAVSRMISQAYSLGQYNRVRKIYRVSRDIYLGLGIVCTLIMGIFCRQLAAAMGQADAWQAIVCLAPCSLLMGFLSAYRGFFQGQGNMLPTSTSQVIEAAVKLIVGLCSAYALMKLTDSVAWAAAGAIIGVSVSCLVSAVYLNRCFHPAYDALEVSAESVDTFRKTADQLLRIAVPITIGSAGLQLLSVVEISVYMDRIEQLLRTGQYQGALIPLLKQQVMQLPDYTPEKLYSLMASSLKGIYNFGYTVFNMPCTLIISINTSVLPAVTACLTLNDHAGVRSTEESAARITGLLAAPCALGISVLAEPIISLLGGYSGEKAVLAGQMLSIMGIGVLFYAFAMFTTVLLQAHNKAHLPVITTLLCGGAKLVAMYFLTGNPNLGILGVPICSILCYTAITVLNIVSLYLSIPQRPRLVQNLLRSLPSALVMGGAVYGCKWLLETMLSVHSRLILCAVPIMLGVIVYFACILLTKTVTREDCVLLPKGEKLARLLKL